MGTIASWNGGFQPLAELTIPVEDRSFYFGDGVYEVVPIYRGTPFLLKEHLVRLAGNLEALEIEARSGAGARVLATVAANKVDNGMVYLQVSRGSGARTHAPLTAYHANELIYAKNTAPSALWKARETGARAITHADLRSGLVAIKTVNLLPNCLAKRVAERQGAEEALLIDREGRVTEGSTSNVFMVKDGIYWTPPAAGQILPGITRAHLIGLLLASGADVRERSFFSNELFTADELFVTGSTTEVVPLAEVDEQRIGNGRRGPLTGVAQELITRSIASYGKSFDPQAFL